MPNIRPISLFVLTALGLASSACAAPVVTTTTSLNIGGSGYSAVDFFYTSTPGAEFTNYRLNFETMNGASIYDPVPRERQNVGGESIDTFMNTVGSVLGLSDATHIQNTYKPVGGDVSPISKIDWSVFDTFRGDTNDIAGSNGGPFHLARVLISPDAQWKATFAAFDTANVGVPATYRFSYDSEPELVQPIVVPPSVITEPVVPPVAPPGPPPIAVPPITDPVIPPPVEHPPLSVTPEPQQPELTDPPMMIMPWPILGVAWPIIIDVGQLIDSGDVPEYIRVDHDGFLIREGSTVPPIDIANYASAPVELADPVVFQSYLNYDLPQDAAVSLLHKTSIAGLPSVSTLLRYNAVVAASADATAAPEPSAAVLALAALAALVSSTRCRR